MQALNVHELPSSLREKYSKLLGDVSGVFEDGDMDNEGFKNDTKFIVENAKTHFQHRHADHKEDDMEVDGNFISFPMDSKSSNSHKGHQYPHMENASTEDDKLYDETILIQDYEPVMFSE